MNMTDYDPFVKQITDEIPDADVDEVRAEFQKYQNNFALNQAMLYDPS